MSMTVPWLLYNQQGRGGMLQIRLCGARISKLVCSWLAALAALSHNLNFNFNLNTPSPRMQPSIFYQAPVRHINSTYWNVRCKLFL